MESFKRPRAAIFDFDGTLVDTFDLVITSYATACRDYFGRELSREEVISRFGPTECDMLRRDLPAHLHDSAIARFRQLYRANHTKLSKVFPGIAEMLAALQEKKIPLGIMTGKGRDTCDMTLSAMGWTNLFGAVITGDESRRPKPDPEGVLMAAGQLGIDPRDCIFVGDAPADIGAGKAAGMRTVWASWHPVYREQIEKLGPDVIAKAPADVTNLFL
jgi:HAD superfamily hydrolase (TIGR01509 family)